MSNSRARQFGPGRVSWRLRARPFLIFPRQSHPETHLSALTRVSLNCIAYLNINSASQVLALNMRSTQKSLSTSHCQQHQSLYEDEQSCFQWVESVGVSSACQLMVSPEYLMGEDMLADPYELTSVLSACTSMTTSAATVTSGRTVPSLYHQAPPFDDTCPGTPLLLPIFEDCTTPISNATSESPLFAPGTAFWPSNVNELPSLSPSLSNITGIGHGRQTPHPQKSWQGTEHAHFTPIGLKPTAVKVAKRAPSGGTNFAARRSSLGARDHYKPAEVRGKGAIKEGRCPLCPAPVWLKIKQSAYWYHMNFTHGISASTGQPHPLPLRYRTVLAPSVLGCANMREASPAAFYSLSPANNAFNEQLIEGLCGRCGEWIPIAAHESSGHHSGDPVLPGEDQRDFDEFQRASLLENINHAPWFKHVQKCTPPI